MTENHTPSARDIFGQRVERYMSMEVFSEEKYYQPVIEAARPRPDDKVLDLACGSGLLAVTLARQTATVVGCDITPEMVESANARLASSGATNLKFIEAEASELPFSDGSFDLVTCRTAFHHFPNPDTALAEIYRVLADGGRLVLSDVFGPDDRDTRATRERIEKLFDPSHIMSYRLSELEAMFSKAGFVSIRVAKEQSRGFPLTILLELDRLDDEKSRALLADLLEENLDKDLGGFLITKEHGRLFVHYQLVMVTTRKSTAS